LSAKPPILACCLLAVTTANAQDPLACGTSIAEPLGQRSALSLTALENPETIRFETGQIDAQLGDSPTAVMTGGVLLRRADRLAGAETARYDPTRQAIELEGDVRYEDPSTQVLSDSATFSYGQGIIRFEGAEFSLGNASRGGADRLEINQNGTLTLDRVEYTTCPPGSEDWLLQGKSIQLDTRAGVGTAKSIKLRFKGVPILYAPYLSFPIGDARKSGFLTPEIGSQSRSGNELSVPWYWNIAPNYDALITPRLLTDRGLQWQTKFRYLTNNSEGFVVADYLRDDNITNTNRQQLHVRNRGVFANGWRNQINLWEVSDSQYFEDLGGSLSSSSITHLDRYVRFDFYTNHLALFGQVQNYQTIDDAIPPDQRPYERLPQLLLDGMWPTRFLDLGLKTELVNFDRDIGVTGWRFNIAPTVAIPIRKPGWYITPALEYDFTQYDLSNTDPGIVADPSRSIPITSVDMGMSLERTMKNPRRIQTLEPRLLYVDIPYRDQADLPIFDTIIPDINLVQLFRKNRFVGIDRIGDTRQLSVGITSRVLDTSTGRELFTATIGQTRYFDPLSVTLPGTDISVSESSDYIAQVNFLLRDNLNFDIGHQWGTQEGGTTKSEARLQYRPAGNKILNFAYRYRRDTLEQGDISWSWPIKKRWNFVGRYNYSFRDEEALEQFFGLEYESCCWGLRLISRRYISTRDGTQDSSFGLQLVLKGMTSVGTAADKLLERGILGYSADLR